MSFIELQDKTKHGQLKASCIPFFAYTYEYKYDCSQQPESMLPCVEGAPISTEATTKAQSTTALSTTSGTSTPPRTSLNSKVTTEAAATQRPTTLTTKGQLKLPAVTRDQKEITDGINSLLEL